MMTIIMFVGWLMCNGVRLLFSNMIKCIAMYPDRRLIGRQIERTLQSEPNVNVMFIYGKKKKKVSIISVRSI
jgi:hypothetical protein